MKKFKIIYILILVDFLTSCVKTINDNSGYGELNVELFLNNKIVEKISKDGKTVISKSEILDENSEVYKKIFTIGEKNNLKCSENNIDLIRYNPYSKGKSNLSNEIYDITLDLTYFSFSNKNLDIKNIPKSRINKAIDFFNGGFHNKKIKKGDKVILRFLGTIDYGEGNKNIPLDDKITIYYQDKIENVNITETIKSKIECIYNKSKHKFYLKFKSDDISFEKIEVKKLDDKLEGLVFSYINNSKFEVGKRKSYLASEILDIEKIMKKEFDFRFGSGKYSKGTYLIEYLDNSDIFDENQNKHIILFTDAKFQLHPNLKSSSKYKNIDINSYNFDDISLKLNSKAFYAFYKDFLQSLYLKDLKSKCNKNDIYIIGIKDNINKEFEKVSKSFYTGLFPNCKVIFK